MKKIIIISSAVLLVCCLIFGYGYITHFQLKDSKQVEFIRTFISSFEQTDALDGRNLIRDQLYDKKIIGNLYDFGWYHAASVHYKSANSVQTDKTEEIAECMDYLSKVYPSTNIEVYQVHLGSVMDSDKPESPEKDAYDVFYLAPKDDKYYLLYTQDLFENSKQTAESVKASSDGYINPEDIEWVTMQGGLHIHTKALFPGHDDEIINRVVGLVNSGVEKTASTDTEINVVNSQARPMGIFFMLKDGSKVYAWTDYTTKSFKDGWSATTLDDRFVMQVQNNNHDEYFTIFSRDVAKYLREGWKEEMPIVPEVEVKSGSNADGDKVVIRNGDKAVVSGDGCIAKEVAIRIMRNGNPEEIYPVGKVVPEYGHWKWEGNISAQCKTLDGETVTLAKDLYDIIADAGGSQIGVCGVIDLRDEKKAEE